MRAESVGGTLCLDAHVSFGAGTYPASSFGYRSCQTKLQTLCAHTLRRRTGEKLPSVQVIGLGHSIRSFLHSPHSVSVEGGDESEGEGEGTGGESHHSKEAIGISRTELCHQAQTLKRLWRPTG